MSSQGCSRCKKSFSSVDGLDFSGFDRENWIPRTSNEHKHSTKRTLDFHRFSVFVWTGDYDSNMLRVVAFENGDKNLRNQKYPDITAWPIFVHLCLFHVFLFPLCLVFYFTLEKECLIRFALFCPCSFVSFFVVVTNMKRMEI